MEDAAAHPRSTTKASEAQQAAKLLADAKAAEVAAGALAAGEPLIIEEAWYPILVGLYGDTPFAAKIRRSVGAAAATGCPNCLLLASKKVPNEDGTPSDEVLKATAYGGVSEMAQCQEPQYNANGDKIQQFRTIDNFTYQTDDGKFDRVAAESLLITDELDELLADEADRITAEQRVWFRDTLHARLAALGNSTTDAAKRKGAWAGGDWADCICRSHSRRPRAVHLRDVVQFISPCSMRSTRGAMICTFSLGEQAGVFSVTCRIIGACSSSFPVM